VDELEEGKTIEDYPDALQIEVTNRCNFKCKMCIRNVWNAKPQDINLDLFKKIASESFSIIDKVILYGLGEPLMHHNFIDLLKIANKELKRDGKIMISTNGSLLSERLAEKLLKEIGLDVISFSIDSIDESVFSVLRGPGLNEIMKNFYYVVKLKRFAKRDFNLDVEIVLMKDNFMDLPKIIKYLGEIGVDHIVVSNVAPYTREILEKIVYLTLSKPSLDLIKSSVNYGWDLILESTRGFFGKAYGLKDKNRSLEIIESIWKDAEKIGYWINLPLLLESKDKFEIIKSVDEILRKSEKIAREYQIKLILPKIYPDANDRKCPYVEKRTMCVRSDGLAFPCMELMYSHPLYVNLHIKNVLEMPIGDLNKEGVIDIWGRDVYVNFRYIRKNMGINIPWCGDCPYSTLSCFFVKNNEIDCYSNEPGCNECLYSADIVKCNI
jgi:MoaA/NifB/PqqE/SkfB family radical SAM enzyme